MGQFKQIPNLLGVGQGVSAIQEKDLIKPKDGVDKPKGGAGKSKISAKTLQSLNSMDTYKFLDKAVGAITQAIPGFATDQIDLASADRAGFKRAAQGQEVLNMFGVGQLFNAVGGDRMVTFDPSAYMDTLGSGFTGSAADFSAAQGLSGKKLSFGKEQAKSFLTLANSQSAMINALGYASELAKSNSAGELYQTQNLNKYQGYSPTLLLGKKGGTIPELETARTILKSGSKKDISKYQLGGKIIDPSKNIIPDGALHKNKNHLSEHNDELKDQITEKGIPVVSENADGTITQHAEVEVGEVIFNLANTKIIEDYWQQYKETGDDSIAIECGKFLTKELLRNTVDKAGIKKEIE